VPGLHGREARQVRLFIAVLPPPGVVRALEALPRPDLRVLRWTTPEQWHVTLAFLGEVDAGQVPVVATAIAVAAARAADPPEATLGPATTRVGRSLLWAPVGGLDDLAAATRAALDEAGAPLAEAEAGRPFRGHVTLARSRGRHAVPAVLAGTPVTGRWQVDSLCLVRSTLDPDHARYETIAEATVPS
jgi:RNA 2',3'-cyclic 3'-phosphodiesterase